MTLTGLFLLTIGPGQSSPTATLIQHISRSFPAEPLPTFHLEHRLFVDTSSLLPSSDTVQRKLSSLLTLSHSPATAYVATTLPKEKTEATESLPTSTLIAIPSDSAESFTQLIGTKLQPLWAHRQSLILENGTSLSLKQGEWIIRIGDLKTPQRPNQAGSNLRGMLIEVSHIDDNQEKHLKGSVELEEDVKVNGVAKEGETQLLGFLDSVTDGSGIPHITSLDATRYLIRHTATHEKDKNGFTTSPDYKLAELYLDILRGPRG